MMTDEQGLAGVTEEEIAEVTAKLVRWSTTLTEREQAALASTLKQAAGDDDTRGHIIIVGGFELARAEVVRRGVLAGASSPEQLPPTRSLPSIVRDPRVWS